MEKEYPLVTIAITSYNYAEHVRDAVASALNQTYRNLEVLVLDNASTDDSVAVIRTFDSDERLRIVIHAENIGIQRNHNAAIDHARGEFLVFLSADDVLLPTFIEDAIAYRRRHSEIDIVYMTIATMDRTGNILGNFDHPALDSAESYSGRNEFASLLTRDMYMYLPTILFPIEVFAELGYLDETITILLDYEFVIRMAAAGKRFGFCSTPSALIRMHGENRSGVQKFVGTGEQLREFCSILERYTQPKFHQALSGYRPQLGKMIENKLHELRSQFPDVAEQRITDLGANVQRALASIATVPDISESVLRGEGLISVVIPYHGRIGSLQRALESLAAQTYDRWEAVIATDFTIDPQSIVDHMGLSDRVRVTRSRVPLGPARARNVGLLSVNGEIIAYLDDDNRFEPGYLRLLSEAFCDSAVKVTVGKFNVSSVSASGHTLLQLHADDIVESGTVSYVSNTIPLNAVAHRRSCIGEVGNFNTALLVLEDWEFLLRLERCAQFQALEQPVCTICVDVMRMGHQVFGRSTSPLWSEVAARVQDIYQAYPVRNLEEQVLRQSFAQRFESIVQAGVNSTGDPAGIVEFQLQLSGLHRVGANA